MEIKSAGRVERKKEETHNRIINVAVDLFHQQGLDATTMEQIAEVADVAKGTLYHYFPSKEAIINAFLQRSFRERNGDRIAQLRALPDTRARLVHVFTLLVDGVRAQKEIFERYMVYRMKQVLSFRPEEGERSGLLALAQEIIRLGQAGGDLRSDLPEEMLEDLFEFALIEAFKPFYLKPETYDARASIERCVDLFINGAKA